MTLRRQIEEVLDKHEPCLTQVQMTWLRLDPAHRHRKQMYGSRRGKGGGVNQELGTNICTLLYIKHEEGNGNPLQDSCLENPMDREAWQAAVYGVARVGHDRATKKAHTHIYKTINKDLLHSIGNYIQCFVIIYKGKESEICACVCIYIYIDTWASQVALVVKNSPPKAGDIRDAGLIPGSRSPGGRHGNPLQYSYWHSHRWRKEPSGLQSRGFQKS